MRFDDDRNEDKQQMVTDAYSVEVLPSLPDKYVPIQGTGFVSSGVLPGGNNGMMSVSSSNVMPINSSGVLNSSSNDSSAGTGSAVVSANTSSAGVVSSSSSDSSAGTGSTMNSTVSSARLLASVHYGAFGEVLEGVFGDYVSDNVLEDAVLTDQLFADISSSGGSVSTSNSSAVSYDHHFGGLGSSSFAGSANY